MKKTLVLLLAAALVLTGMLAGCNATQPTAQPAGDAPSAEAPKTEAPKTDTPSTPADTGGNTKDPIRIGVLESYTGSHAAYGDYETRGIELALAEYPEILGRPVELVKVDAKSDVVECANGANRLASKENVDAVIGPWGSSMCIAAGPAFEEAKIPAITAAATNVNVTKGNEYYYRVCYLDKFQSDVLAEFAYNELSFRKMAVVYEITNDASVAQGDYIKTKFTECGGEVSEMTNFSLGDTDFNAQLMAIQSKSPDAIAIVGSATEIALFIKQARSLGYDIPFLSVDGIDVPEFVTVGGSDVDGTIFTTFFDPAAPINDITVKFNDMYTKKYNEEPAALSALAYDCYVALYNAFEKAGSTDGPAVKAALDELIFDGATGTLKFDENGDAIKDTPARKGTPSA